MPPVKHWPRGGGVDKASIAHTSCSAPTGPCRAPVKRVGGCAGPAPPHPEFLEAPKAPKKIVARPKAREKIWPTLKAGGSSGVGWGGTSQWCLAGLHAAGQALP